MNKTILISNVAIANAKTESRIADLLLEGGKIAEIGESLSRKADFHIDGNGKNWVVMPGFIDVHIHGSSGFDTMDATPEALNGLASSLPREGTTSFLATTMTQSDEAISKALQTASAFQADEQQAEMLGVHLEGPFISPEMAGAQPLEYIMAPSLSLFEKWQELSGKRIKQVTIAPEADHSMEFIRTLSADGVVASIGHSNASFEKVQEAIAAGAKQVTHLYNQMSPFHHRNPGVVGAAFLEESLAVELIADFVHSHQQSVRLAYQQIGASRLILITDAMRAKGLAPGTYDLGGQGVQVSERDARLPNGALAGSILTMETAAKNVKAITDCTWPELAAMTSANAARQLGLENKGVIATGKDADLVILDEDANVQLTICRGNISYAKEELQ
ncbi:N-acetylglucosamine-6-phosphate deacetylase [Planococcus sp. CP5-4]|nr:MULTISPECIES: N-acetylglucosamine-6-phosphate deacetylase [unclassified Planococcus (in: firmicutes)]MBU9673801.1 N-acetylglucosamine-6-phosphate deacetylase [Planococcus sp. CP5-4_YE]MBV0908929.1 N-acetylglucosamine-6-phosphate deacetylase [Planococcus sp. CP5-4_UN]MBW6063978.1 N-acetylglucosamine-6-phosphate deacetylase [Planococcus sp. CP5-4]